MTKAITCLVLALALGLAGCVRSAPAERAHETVQAVRVSTVRHGPVVEGRRYLGVVAPAETIRVLDQVPGAVSGLPVVEGGSARRGGVLARIAAPELAARLERVRAERSRAERQRDLACDSLERSRALASSGAITPLQLDTAEASCATVEHAVSAARAAEDEVSTSSGRTVERAPFDGRVLEHLVDPGQTVMPGMPLLLFGTDGAELLLRVPQEQLADGVGLGSAAVFEGGRGVVTRVGGQATGPGGLVELRVRVDPPELLPMIGATVPVRLVVDERHDATAVPLDAVGSDAGGSWVLRVDGDRALRTPVTTGPRADGWIVVEPPLAPGTEVVVADVERVVLDVPLLPVLVEP